MIDAKKNQAMKKSIDMLPHKFPFVMVDQVLDYQKGEWIKGLKYIGNNSEIRFGSYHVMLCESLAQLSKALDMLSRDLSQNEISYLTSVKVDFRGVVDKGDCVELYCRWTNRFNGMYCFEVEATVESAPVLKGNLFRKVNDQNQNPAV